MAYYVNHADHPGNPWGPFATRADAQTLIGELTRTFADRFDIVPVPGAPRSPYLRCYHCGQSVPAHLDRCIDHPVNRARMSTMSQAEIETLITR